MTSSALIVAYLVFSATLVRALAVQTKLAAPTCSHCGEKLERRALGEPVCRCRVS